MNSDCSNALSLAEYCEHHESYYHPFPGLEGKCPWCERDKYRDELELIKEIFQAAVNSKTQKGGQHVPYHGDFASIAPSTIGQMEWYIRRWNEVLK